jgi:integrase
MSHQYLMSDLAKQYVMLQVYNDATRETMLRAARLFDQRSKIKSVDEIDWAVLSRFRDATLAVAKPVTLNGYIRYLRVLGQWAHSQGLMSRNWFMDLKLSPAPKATPKALEISVFYQALAHLDRHADQFKPAWFWKIVVRFFYYTGIRRRQLSSLVWGDVDLKAERLKLSYRGSKTLREWDIAIARKLVPELIYLREESERVLGRPVSGEDPVFNVRLFYSRYKINKKNPGHLTGEQITGLYKRLSVAIGHRFGVHATRHTVATELCNPADGSEPDLFSIQQLLGHTMLSTTRGYVSTKVETIRRTVEKLQHI